ncbi:MAG: hypothetical protein RPR97_04670 [Colwellia sp.]
MTIIIRHKHLIALGIEPRQIRSGSASTKDEVEYISIEKSHLLNKDINTLYIAIAFAEMDKEGRYTININSLLKLITKKVVTRERNALYASFQRLANAKIIIKSDENERIEFSLLEHVNYEDKQCQLLLYKVAKPSTTAVFTINPLLENLFNKETVTKLKRHKNCEKDDLIPRIDDLTMNFLFYLSNLSKDEIYYDKLTQQIDTFLNMKLSINHVTRSRYSKRIFKSVVANQLFLLIIGLEITSTRPNREVLLPTSRKEDFLLSYNHLYC